MRKTVLAAVLLAGITWFSPAAITQETKSARGTVTAIAGDTVTVKAGASELKFAVDAKTIVNVEGGSTASRQAAAKGQPGPKINELIKVGDAVEVSYREQGASLHAASIRRVSTAGPGGGTTSDERASQKAETSSGTVSEVSGTSLTIAGSGAAGSTFTQTFAIDSDTKVVGEGVGTAAAKAGGKVSFTDHVGKGDRVTVTYRAKGKILHAEQVRITQKSK